mmetsp:Transcript_3644/g.6420  ORF Transcript_3644/g.6420 Transcript_3644/m.6420 type:complete len:115 (-) Transcript_3644:27-371(-)
MWQERSPQRNSLRRRGRFFHRCSHRSLRSSPRRLNPKPARKKQRLFDLNQETEARDLEAGNGESFFTPSEPLLILERFVIMHDSGMAALYACWGHVIATLSSRSFCEGTCKKDL